MSAGVPLPAGTSLFLILMTLKMSDVLPSGQLLEFVCYFSPLLHWDCSWKESLRDMKSHFHSVLRSVCCKPVPCSAHFEHLLGFCTVNLSPTPLFSCRQAGGREGGPAQRSYLGQKSCLPHGYCLPLEHI